MNHGVPASSLDEGPVDLTGNDSQAPTSASRQSGQASSKRTPTQSKINSLGRLLATLDSLLYLELCAIYYLDNITLLFFLRVVVQFTYLTPKPANIPLPKHRPYVGSIIGTNLLCLLLHVVFAAPAAGEPTRGYLHGSLIIDFVGQRGPTSQIRLMGADLVVLTLQLLSLCVIVDLGREKDKTGADTPTGQDAPTADVDGRRETASLPSAETEVGIELQQFAPLREEAAVIIDGDDAGHNEAAAEDDNLISTGIEDVDDSSQHPLDPYFSGQVVLADFHVIDTIRNQFWDYRSSGRSAV